MSVIERLSEDIDRLTAELSEANAEIERQRSQLVKAQALLREFLPAAVADDARQRAAAFLTDETR